MSLKASSYLLCFRAAFQADKIYKAFHKYLSLWEVEIILIINDNQDMKANPTYLIFKATKDIALGNSNTFVLYISVKTFFSSAIATPCYKYMKFMRGFSISWRFLCWCVLRSLSTTWVALRLPSHPFGLFPVPARMGAALRRCPPPQKRTAESCV